MGHISDRFCVGVNRPEVRALAEVNKLGRGLKPLLRKQTEQRFGSELGLGFIRKPKLLG